jgi:hypothetical protein
MNAHAGQVVEFPTQKKRRGRAPIVSTEQIKSDVEAKLTIQQMMDKHSCSRGTINKALRNAKVWMRPNARKGAPRVPTAKARFEGYEVGEKTATLPPVNHPAVTGGRTIFPGTVKDATGTENVLVEGKNSRKIGGLIFKGRWKDFPIYTLTLEERATCPKSCVHWRSCYGNGMHMARRNKPGSMFEARLGLELALLQSRFPKGFAVRLHVLGDFYSVDYVQQWAVWIESFPALHVFGFTARWDTDKDPIAAELVRFALQRGDRFKIRFSNAPIDEWSTVSVEHPLQVPADAILCPQQLGKTESCGTCALCWQSSRRIAFLQH